ncbi:MAG: dihydroorotase [Bacteroidia bacterium]|nr:dihydroorotase [Bacteroidia bacterium]
MLKTTLIKNATVVNEGVIAIKDVLIKDGLIDKVDNQISLGDENHTEINAEGLHLLPGVIDDQVHFREPGLTHKAEIYTESKAAVAGGITSFMEMPNTVPQAVTQELLKDKYDIASKKSIANYSFFMGTTNDNIDEILKTNIKEVSGVKIFMGSSTGNMLVDDEKTLDTLFSQCPMLIATHCEDEKTVKENFKKYYDKYGDDIPIEMHPIIRSDQACYLSSSFAIELAKKNNARLHVLHISTEKELELFKSDLPLREKRITSEVCIHHLWFSDEDYADKKTFIKWNPAVKTKNDRAAIWKGLLDDTLDIIATDHAPHTLEEKQNVYTKAPSGGPLVQHALVAMLECYHNGKISLEKIVEKMSHAPAICFKVEKRGYLREGYYADLVLVDLNKKWKVDKSNLLYKCGWSPFEGQEFKSSVAKTFVNGNLVYNEGTFDESSRGMRLKFDR